MSTLRATEAPDSSPSDLLIARLATDPASPLVTFYDDDSGERTELSTASFANWVAKTSGLLVDVFDVRAGDFVAIHLPTHWQTAVWLHACWAVGAIAAPFGDAESCSLAVCSADTLDDCLDAPDIVVCSLLPMGAPFPTPLPVGVSDYIIEVRGMPDRFDSERAPSSADALSVMGTVLSGAAIVEHAHRLLTRDGGDDGERVLISSTLDTNDNIAAACVAPLISDGSVVLSTWPWDDADPRIASERITRRA